MILRAKQEQNILVFELEGTLDFETTHQLSQTCQDLMSKNSCSQVVFDFSRLKFVGSSGIHQFIGVLKEFNGFKVRPRLCHLSVEFDKIVKAFQSAKKPFAVFTNRLEAIASFANDKPVVTKTAPEKAEKTKPFSVKKKTARRSN